MTTRKKAKKKNDTPDYYKEYLKKYVLNKKLPLWKRIGSAIALVIMVGLVLIAPITRDPFNQLNSNKFPELKELRIENDTSPIINIPDPKFRSNLKSRGFDLNSDGEFSQYEIDALLEHSTNCCVSLAGEGRLESVEGIQHFKGLGDFYAQDSKIKDLTPFEDMENLSYLHLMGSEVKDLKSIALIGDNLEGVLITESQIEDVTPLLDVELKLEILNLRDNPIRRKAPEYVFCGYIGAETYGNYKDPDTGESQPYEAWAKWVEVDIDKDRLKTSPAIEFKDENLKKALLKTHIDITGDGEISIYEAERLKGWLELVECNISDITGLEYFDNIYYLDLSKNQIEDIDLLFEMDRLKYLIADGNRIQKINTLEQGKRLIYLDLWNNTIQSFTDIGKNSTIETLYIGKNPIMSLNGLEYFPKLKKLVADKMKIDSLQGIESNIFLEYIRLSQNPFMEMPDLSVLKNMENLRYINVYTYSAGAEELEILRESFK